MYYVMGYINNTVHLMTRRQFKTLQDADCYAKTINRDYRAFIVKSVD